MNAPTQRPGAIGDAALEPPQQFPLGQGRPALFIDKDGTLVENVPYNADPALLRFMPGALSALAAIDAAGIALVVVSNQSGLALGKFTAAQFDALREALTKRLHDEAGVRLTDFLYCPHAPGDDGAPACACRKPAPGMLLQAAQRHGLDLQRSWIVGDTLDDIEAGHRADCRGLLYDSGGETLWRRGPGRQPDQRMTDWHAVAHAVLSGGSAMPIDAPGDAPVSVPADGARQGTLPRQPRAAAAGASCA